MVRRGISFILFALALTVLPAACKQVPDNTLETNDSGERPADGEETSSTLMVEDAANAFEQTPRTIERVKRSAAMYSEAFKSTDTRDYESLWKGARTAAWLAEYLEDETEREEYTREGLTWVNTALEVKPDGHEALFYHGVLAGFLGDLDNTYGLDAVDKIQSDMTTLIEADADVAHGGPWRAYGVLLIRAPGPPASIGSLRNGRKTLQAAVEKAPEWPENHLYMAEAEFLYAEDKDKPEYKESAIERLNKWLLGDTAKPPAGFEFEFKAWQKKAQALLDDHK